MKKPIPKGIFLLLSCLVLGCSGTPDSPSFDPTEILSSTDEHIFVGDPMEANYDPNVIMKRAESYFEKESYPEAIVEYKHFLDLHRSHVLAPYAQYKIALTHYKRFRTVDRDNEPIQKSLANFEKLLTEFPNSRYEAEAQEKIKICHQHLAAHHLLVGEFYYNKESYLAAAGRFEKIISTYPQLAAAADAKYQLARTYQDMGAQQWAADWLVDFVQHHPENENYEDGMEMLVALQEENPNIEIALNPTNEVQDGLGIFNAGYQSHSEAIESSSAPLKVAHLDSPSLSSPGMNGHSSAEVHTITEQALCSLGSWCESTPASSTLRAAPATKTCQIGQWC